VRKFFFSLNFHFRADFLSCRNCIIHFFPVIKAVPTRTALFEGDILMKRMIIFLFTVTISAALSVPVFANSAPVVSNVSVSQRTDGSGIVDISYTLSDADNDRCTVSVVVSNDGGSTWTITPSAPALSGDLTNVSPGSRHITWNSKFDLPGVFGSNYRIKITADDGYTPMTWVSINDPGVSGHEAFNGQMSKYETTNAQYC
jgi:hypothetical protein